MKTNSLAFFPVPVSVPAAKRANGKHYLYIPYLYTASKIIQYILYYTVVRAAKSTFNHGPNHEKELSNFLFFFFNKLKYILCTCVISNNKT